MDVPPDGACLFHALSLILHASDRGTDHEQTDAYQLRRDITDHMSDKKHDNGDSMYAYDYIKFMQQPNSFGTDWEIGNFGELFKINITVVQRMRLINTTEEQLMQRIRSVHGQRDSARDEDYLQTFPVISTTVNYTEEQNNSGMLLNTLPYFKEEYENKEGETRMHWVAPERAGHYMAVFDENTWLDTKTKIETTLGEKGEFIQDSNLDWRWQKSE